MEQLLHYVWRHRLYPQGDIHTHDGRKIEILDPGLPNMHAGPDFFNAKIRIDGLVWAGNVEIHENAADWYRHGHDKNASYDSVVLHVVGKDGGTPPSVNGRTLPQIVLPVPPYVEANYRELLAEDTYPPCYRVIPTLDSLTIRGWTAALTVERLEQKTERIDAVLHRTVNDWEATFFSTLARSFGFGVNADVMEHWASHIDLQQVGKHRDNAFQVEAYFFGQAGLLEEDAPQPGESDDYFRQLQQEYRYLQKKFSLQPMDAGEWRFLRLRPQNFPYVRLSQLVELYCERRANLSGLLAARNADDIRSLFSTQATPYWQSHYTFGQTCPKQSRRLQAGSLDLLIVNAAAPLLFAYGRHHFNEDLSERAFSLLEEVKPENNYITRAWKKAGIAVENAADSQALIQLRTRYCDRRDCLRCRFGCAYLRKART